MSTSDAESSRHHVETTTLEIHNLVMGDWRLKLHEIASAVGISNEKSILLILAL